jgi:SAM-dependent methyltransferase
MTTASAFWDEEITRQQHVSWLEDPLVRNYVNAAIGERGPRWPIEWFEDWLGERKFDRALSIGCGAGPLERGLVKRGLCRTVDAFDGSLVSLHLARETAEAEGVGDRIHYFAADFNEPSFRGRYDVVFFHQSAHHVGSLEKLYGAILGVLKPDGLLYLDEYVGPSRFEWNDDVIAPHRAVYQSLPAALRLQPDVPYPIQADDPSEALRSSEIEPQLRPGFRIVARRPYGGTLLSVLYPLLRRDRLTDAIVERLIDEERAMLARGMPSYYTVTVAQPRRALAKAVASAWYLRRSKRQPKV